MEYADAERQMLAWLNGRRALTEPLLARADWRTPAVERAVHLGLVAAGGVSRFGALAGRALTAGRAPARVSAAELFWSRRRAPLAALVGRRRRGAYQRSRRGARVVGSSPAATEWATDWRLVQPPVLAGSVYEHAETPDEAAAEVEAEAEVASEIGPQAAQGSPVAPASITQTLSGLARLWRRVRGGHRGEDVPEGEEERSAERAPRFDALGLANAAALSRAESAALPQAELAPEPQADVRHPLPTLGITPADLYGPGLSRWGSDNSLWTAATSDDALEGPAEPTDPLDTPPAAQELVAPLAAAVVARAARARLATVAPPPDRSGQTPAESSVWWSPELGAMPAAGPDDLAAEPAGAARRSVTSSTELPPLPDPQLLAQIVADFNRQREANAVPDSPLAAEPTATRRAPRADPRVIETVGPAARRRISAFPPGPSRPAPDGEPRLAGEAAASDRPPADRPGQRPELPQPGGAWTPAAHRATDTRFDIAAQAETEPREAEPVAALAPGPVDGVDEAGPASEAGAAPVSASVDADQSASSGDNHDGGRPNLPGSPVAAPPNHASTRASDHEKLASDLGPQSQPGPAATPPGIAAAEHVGGTRGDAATSRRAPGPDGSPRAALDAGEVSPEPQGGPGKDELFDLPPSVLPERPWEEADPELARVVLGLPGPMAEAALAAGVLSQPGPAAPGSGGLPDARPMVEPHRPELATTTHAAPSTSVRAEMPRRASRPARKPTSAPPTPELVLAPPASPRGVGPASADLVAAGFTWSGPAAESGVMHHGGLVSAASVESSAPQSAATAIQRAPLDRPSATDAADVAASSPSPTPASSEGPQPRDAAELDRLAEEVFGRLRWRLLAERERSMGGA